MSSYVYYQWFFKRDPWISSITSPRNMQETDFQAWPQPYWIRNSGVVFQGERYTGWGGTGVQGQILLEPLNQSCQVQWHRLYTAQLTEMQCTQSRMRMLPPRLCSGKTCIPNLAVLKTVGNPQRRFNRGKTQSEWSGKRCWWYWCYLGDRWWGTTSSHSVPCIYPWGCLQAALGVN